MDVDGHDNAAGFMDGDEVEEEEEEDNDDGFVDEEVGSTRSLVGGWQIRRPCRACFLDSWTLRRRGQYTAYVRLTELTSALKNESGMSVVLVELFRFSRRWLFEITSRARPYGGMQKQSG